MGLLVLEPKGVEHVPGTELLWKTDQATSSRDIVLVPRPTLHPDDPLNWPLWKKDLILACLCTSTLVAGW
jgi:hypothetical protein